MSAIEVLKMQGRRLPTYAVLVFIVVAPVLAGLITVGVLQHRVAAANPITVDSGRDENIVNGICALLAAIIASNTGTTVNGCLASSGTGARDLPRGAYSISVPGGGGDADATEDPDITDDVTITGGALTSGSTIQVNPNTRYQTIVGWEATAAIGIEDFPDDFHRWRDEVNNRAVNEVGINRLRLETHQEKDAVEASNDNSDPFVIDWDGFNFTEFDKKIDHIVLPIKQHVEANGERLYVNFITVSVADRAVNPLHIDPDEFAEVVLAHFLHMQSKYGFVPDAVEVSLEPNVFNTFDEDPKKYGAALVATGDLLAANGFHPDFIAPSNSTTSSAIQWFDDLIQVPRVRDYLTEFAYHRYDVNSGDIQQIASRAQQHGLGTSMLEHIGADYHELHEDLKVAGNVAWQQYTIAYPTSDNGAQYYPVSDPSNPTVTIGSKTKFLRQYFKFVRRGAVRIDASSTDGRFDPLAFINPDGNYVVVVKASDGGSFSIGGLPAGTYGIKYTTSSQYNVDLADAVISGGQSLTANIPNDGVITIYGKLAAAGPAQAAPSLTSFLDPSDESTGLKLDITRVFDPTTGNDVNVTLESFQARLTYPDASANPAFPAGTRCVNILDVRGLDLPMTDRNIDNMAGVATFDGSDASGVPWPADLGHALTRLTGSTTQQCRVDLELTSLSDVSGNPIGVPTVLSQLVQRGDARADGTINIADALFIAQYLVGLRAACTDTVGLTCLHSVNAASVRHDGASDQKTIADALFIAQYLVGLRDEFYNVVQ